MIYIDKQSKTPVYVQLYNALKEDITHNKKQGDKLDPIRTMAKQLGVSINTVDKAYQQLLVEGYVTSVAGSGYYCNEIEHQIYEGSHVEPSPAKAPVKVKYDFIYGGADNREFPWGNWKKCVKEALLQAETESILNYGDKQGNYSLRRTLASLLKDTRGVICHPDQIVICCGVQNAIDTIASILPPARNRLGFEEPGYERARRSFQRNHYPIMPIPVDDDGLSTDALEDSDCNLVYVTPSHQFPTGAVMPIARRHQLVRIMHEKEGYIIEDDYDSEFCYETLSIPSLQALGNNSRVIYLGSLSKSLSPTFRISYMVLPPQLLPEYHRRFAVEKPVVSGLIQTAVEEFIEQGYYAKHLRKLISINEARLHASTRAFEMESCPYIEVVTANSGLHLLLRIRSPHPPQEIARRLEEKSVRIYPAGRYWMNREACDPTLFLMGFASYHPDEIEQGVHILCDTVRAMNE